jgi:hypothetical protein
MKVAVIKLGSRISFGANDCSGANGEARSICKMLKLGGAEVHIFTKILKKDNLVEEYKWHDLTNWQGLNSELELDTLIVLNGTVQFYGGVEDKEQLHNYSIINSFKGRVFYIYCDPELTLKQVWSSVSKKPWASNWKETDLNVTRTDIIYLSQPNDIEQVMKGFGKNEVIPSSIIHFPFEQFPCLNEPLPFNPIPEVDLSYGGTMRGGKREKKMVKFYFGHPEELSVEMFGKITSKDFTPKLVQGLREPTFTGPVRYDEMLSKMNKSMAHCVLGDPYYEKINDIPQRHYESVMAGVVTFMDSDMDKVRRVWSKDRILGDFLYVQTRQELSEKIILLKEDPHLRKQILEDQIAAIAFDPKSYCDDFVGALK